jgi:hypothetical protein
VFGGDAVAALALDGRVDRGERRLGRRVLGHVRRLTAALAVVVQPGGLGRHERRRLDLDLALARACETPG